MMDFFDLIPSYCQAQDNILNKIKGIMVSMSSIWLARVNIMFTQVEFTN